MLGRGVPLLDVLAEYGPTRIPIFRRLGKAGHQTIVKRREAAGSRVILPRDLWNAIFSSIICSRCSLVADKQRRMLEFGARSYHGMDSGF